MDRVQLETFVDGVITQAMASDHIAGVGLAVVDRSGPLLVKGYGVAAPGRPVDPDTLFPQQSISKTLVWIGVMQLVDQGRVRLSDRADPSGPGEGPGPVARPRATPRRGAGRGGA